MNISVSLTIKVLLLLGDLIVRKLMRILFQKFLMLNVFNFICTDIVVIFNYIIELSDH